MEAATLTLESLGASLRTLELSLAADGVATVTLACPAVANALSLRAFDELRTVFRFMGQHSDVRCVLLDAAGKHFCSGIDTRSFKSLLGGDEGATCAGRRNFRLHNDVCRLQVAISSLEACRVPVVAAIHGACLGAGVDLTCAADIRYATTDAQFGVIEAELGFAADLGTLARLHRLVGEGRARELALTCRRFSGVEAKDSGFVSACFEDERALKVAARAVAARIAAQSPLAMVATKAELLYARDASVQQALDHVAWRNAATLASDDLRRALAARAKDKKGGGAVAFSRL